MSQFIVVGVPLVTRSSSGPLHKYCSKMALKTLVGLLTVLSYISVGLCLQCYSCERDDNPDVEEFCKFPSTSELGNNTIKNCSESSNRCQIRKVIQANNKVTLFKRECAEEENCFDGCTDPDEEKQDVVCESCCDEDLCNKGEGPEEAKKSGTSRIAVMMGIYTVAGFLSWLFL